MDIGCLVNHFPRTQTSLERLIDIPIKATQVLKPLMRQNGPNVIIGDDFDLLTAAVTEKLVTKKQNAYIKLRHENIDILLRVMTGYIIAENHESNLSYAFRVGFLMSDRFND